MKSTNRIVSVWEERRVFDATIISRFKTALASGSGHSQRRTRSESDLKRIPPPEAKRVKLEKPASRSSSIDGEPPNSREPPEVSEQSTTSSLVYIQASLYFSVLHAENQEGLVDFHDVVDVVYSHTGGQLNSTI